MTGFVERDGLAFAAYFASCHDCSERVAWLDVVLGTWGGIPAGDHTTFSCGARLDSCMAVDAPVALASEVIEDASVAATLGLLLRREEALHHPRVEDFWAVVDAIVVDDRDVRRQVAGR